MALFTVTVNRKLEEAIELAKPQEGVLTLITSDQCPFCRDFSSQQQAVASQNVDILEERVLMSNEEEGGALIEQYGIARLPAVIFETRERLKVPLQQAFRKNGRMVGDTAFVWEQSNPPYFDLAAGETKGLVHATFLADSSCDGCHDTVQTYKSVLARFGITPTTEETVDIADERGRTLRETYNITRVPTVILSPEVSVYVALASSWQQIGSVEEDGVYVFRNPDVLRVTYRDLSTGEIRGPSTGG